MFWKVVLLVAKAGQGQWGLSGVDAPRVSAPSRPFGKLAIRHLPVKVSWIDCTLFSVQLACIYGRYIEAFIDQHSLVYILTASAVVSLTFSHPPPPFSPYNCRRRSSLTLSICFTFLTILRVISIYLVPAAINFTCLLGEPIVLSTPLVSEP